MKILLGLGLDLGLEILLGLGLDLAIADLGLDLGLGQKLGEATSLLLNLQNSAQGSTNCKF